jgi:hypothetical protein
MTEHQSELLLDRLRVVLDRVAEFRAQLLDLLLQHDERLVLSFFMQNRPDPAQKKPAEKNQNQNRCENQNEGV